MKPENTTGFVGDPAWIHCKGSGRPAPSVNYLRSKDSKTLRMKAPLNESRFETLPNHTLYIKELKMEDNGPYFCWLTQKHASISSDFYLNVKGKFTFKFTLMFITIQISPVRSGTMST